MKKTLLALCSIAILATATAAHADPMDTFTETTVNGECCFQVVLDQMSTTEIGVTVTLLDGATFFANTGSGQHPTFAFDLSGVSGASLSTVLGWTSGGSVSTGGPDFGTFTDQYNLDAPGTSGDVSSLAFDVTVSSGTIGFSSFAANADGYYFAADFLGSDGGTGLGAISNGPTTTGGSTPEPSSLLLLGTGIVGAAGLMRKRMAASRS